MKYLIKVYLKRMNKSQRQLRDAFVGKRLRAKQQSWLHLTSHPWEDNKQEQVEERS